MTTTAPNRPMSAGSRAPPEPAIKDECATTAQIMSEPHQANMDGEDADDAGQILSSMVIHVKVRIAALRKLDFLPLDATILLKRFDTHEYEHPYPWLDHRHSVPHHHDRRALVLVSSTS